MPRSARRPLGAPARAAASAAEPPGSGRPIRLVVPFPPDGAVDTTGRLLAERLGVALNGTVVEKRAPALAATSEPTRWPRCRPTRTIGLATLCAAPPLHRKPPFDPQRDLAPAKASTTGAPLCVVDADTARENG